MHRRPRLAFEIEQHPPGVRSKHLTEVQVAVHALQLQGRVVEITEDPAHRRGGVILERIQA